jgi:hypothetical protein
MWSGLTVVTCGGPHCLRRVQWLVSLNLVRQGHSLGGVSFNLVRQGHSLGRVSVTLQGGEHHPLDRRDKPRRKEQPMVDEREVDLSGIPPRPTAMTPEDVDAIWTAGTKETTLDPAERAWLEAPGKARQRTALLVGLAVVAVIVSWLVYRRFQR